MSINCGSFFAFRRDVYEKIGSFDANNFFIWFEEVDFCKRVREAGLRVWYSADVACIDLVGRSFHQRTARWKQYHLSRSMTRYFQKVDAVVADGRPVRASPCRHFVWCGRRSCRRQVKALEIICAWLFNFLTFNRLETLRALFDSLAAQTDRDWAFYILDNSTDEAKATLIAALVEEQKGRLSIVFERSSSNIGFTGGHQHLYERHNADYVMCVNDDVILEPNILNAFVAGSTNNPKSPRLVERFTLGF